MGEGVDHRFATRAAAASPDVRERWRMGPEARGLVLVSAVLTAFGLAVLYSASAFVAVQEHRNSAYFLVKQLAGVGAGVIAFAVSAKIDAEVLQRWAWPMMWFAIATMAAVLVLPASIAPTIHGSQALSVRRVVPAIGVREAGRGGRGCRCSS